MQDRRRRAWLRPALSFMGVMTLTACLGLAVARVSADSPRAFPVLSPDDSVTLDGDRNSVADVAARFRPRIAELPQDRDDPVVGMAYEAWREGTDLVVTYFVRWSDERHPDAAAHTLYGAYRWAFYRGRQDIEYVQLRLDAAGTLREVRFESAADLDPWTFRPVHVDALATRRGDVLARRLADAVGDRPREVEVPAPADGRVTLYVATWNHLLDVVPPPLEGAPRVDSPIPTHRGAQAFAEQAGARRGHPSPDNQETAGRAVAGRVGGLLYLASPAVAVLAVILLRRRAKS